MDDIVIRALKFGAHKHRHQKRAYLDEETIPYFNHPIDVMHILAIEAEVTNPFILAAALLHDTIEDTDTTAEELQEIFGPEITALVLEASDDQDIPIEQRYAQQIAKVPHYSEDAKLIKMADRIANIRDAAFSPPPHWTKERQLSHMQQSRKIMDLFRGTHAKLDEIYDLAYEQAITIAKN